MEQNGFDQPEYRLPPARISSVFKNSGGFCQQKKTLVKQRSPSPIAEMKDSLENKFPLYRKKSFLRQDSLKKYIKNGFQKTENPFPLPGMRHSLKTTFPRYGKTASPDKKIKETGFPQQENVFLLKLVPNYFNSGFQHQKKALN